MFSYAFGDVTKEKMFWKINFENFLNKILNIKFWEEIKDQNIT